jgi:hypothetical protein
VSARLRSIGRDLQSKLKDFFEHPLDAGATPLELLQAALEELERRVQPAGRGRKTFPYDRVVVHITQRSADEAAVMAVFRDLGARLRDRLAELNCERPETIDTSVVLNETAGDDTTTTVRVDCFGAVEIEPERATAMTARPSITLTVMKGQCGEAEYVLDEPVIAIGRTAEPTDALGQVRYNHVAFLETRDGINETVGRAHARLQFDPASSSYILYNESSSNPTSIIRAGRAIRVAPRDPRGVRVMNGDQLQLGRAVLRVTLG